MNYVLRSRESFARGEARRQLAKTRKAERERVAAARAQQKADRAAAKTLRQIKWNATRIARQDAELRRQLAEGEYQAGG